MDTHYFNWQCLTSLNVSTNGTQKMSFFFFCSLDQCICSNTVKCCDKFRLRSRKAVQ